MTLKKLRVDAIHDAAWLRLRELKGEDGKKAISFAKPGGVLGWKSALIIGFLFDLNKVIGVRTRTSMIC